MGRTKEARSEPPNQTAKRWRLWEMTSTSTPDDCEWTGERRVRKERVGQAYPGLATARQRSCFEPAVDDLLEIPLETLAEVLEHGRTARQHDVLQFTLEAGIGRGKKTLTL